MINYIKGKLVDIDDGVVTIDVGGVGYGVFVTGMVINSLPTIGEDVILHTYLYVREDNMCLYGFESKESLKLFKMLITVNGIGPKGAIAILSTLTPDELAFAVLSDDSKAIAKAPGIGAKTAVKAILELKDKMDLLDAFNKKSANVASVSHSFIQNDAVNETVMALTALGYNNSQALAAVKACEVDDSLTSEELLKLALKEIIKLGF